MGGRLSTQKIRYAPRVYQDNKKQIKYAHFHLDNFSHKTLTNTLLLN